MKVIITLFIAVIALSVAGQNKSIEGNGETVYDKKMLPSFNAIYVDLFCDVYVQTGSMPLVDIWADKNVINKLKIEVRGKELRISAKEGYWIQRSRPKIYIQTPFVTKLTTKGQQTNIGDIVIEDIKVDQFTADIFYGTIRLQGEVNTLKLNSSNNSYYAFNGTVDASQLWAKEVEADIKGRNRAQINVSDRLIVNLMHDAVLEYQGNPHVVDLQGDAGISQKGMISARSKNEVVKHHDEISPGQLTYISLKVKNNSPWKKNFIIQGPSAHGKDFSYGFPMMPFAVREKKVPLGTAIYLQKAGTLKQKLIDITSEDEGQIRDLFGN
jgi:hypothetical protein